MHRRLGATRRFMIALGFAFVAASGGGEGVRAQPEAIIGGTPDSADTWVVGIDIGGMGVCSGTLIAPNLVLTARHCVSQTSQTIDCSPTGIDTQKVFANFAPSVFRVTTAPDLSGTPAWSVTAVYYVDDATCMTPATACRLCGYDLALLELAPGASGFPTTFGAPSATAPSIGDLGTAIGYGCQNVPDAMGNCTLGARMSYGPARVLDLTALDIVTNARVCGGDSGGPFASGGTAGILSRGDSACMYGIYTRTDAHFAWLQHYGALAASHGGYTAPPWVGLGATRDAGTGASLGTPCVMSSDCESGLCIEVGGTTRCSQSCAPASPCPSPFMCASGYCIAMSTGAGDGSALDAAAVLDADADHADRGLVGTCACRAMGARRAGENAVPIIVVALLGALLVRCRSRRRSPLPSVMRTRSQ